MGYLAYGAMAGVADEYLKQSGEERQNKYQELRDKRLAEMTTTENIRSELVQSEAAGLERDFRSGENAADREARKTQSDAETASREAIAQGDRDWDSNNYEAPIGTTVTRDGKVVQQGQHAPTSASTAAAKWNETKVYRRGVGGEKGAATTYKELADEWKEIAYIDTKTTDDLGNPIVVKQRDPRVPGLIEYQNQGVTDEYQLEPNDPSLLMKDPSKLWKFYQSQPQFNQPGGKQLALDAMKKLHSWWSPDMEGGTSLDNPRVASPNPNEANPAAGPGQGGYLSQGQTPAAPAAPLNSGASTSNAPAPSTAQQLDSAKQQLEAVTAAIKQKRESGVPISGRVQERAQYMKLQNQIKELEAQLNTEGQQQASDQFEAARQGSGNSFLPTIQ